MSLTTLTMKLGAAGILALPAAAQFKSGSDTHWNSANVDKGARWYSTTSSFLGRNSSFDWASLDTEQRVENYGKWFTAGEMNFLAYEGSTGRYARMLIWANDQLVKSSSYAPSPYWSVNDTWQYVNKLTKDGDHNYIYVMGKAFSIFNLKRTTHVNAFFFWSFNSEGLHATALAKLRTEHYQHGWGAKEAEIHVWSLFPEHTSYMTMDTGYWGDNTGYASHSEGTGKGGALVNWNMYNYWESGSYWNAVIPFFTF